MSLTQPQRSTMPSASVRPLIDGELHLRWIGQPGAVAKAAQPVEVEHEDETGGMREALERLPTVQRLRLMSTRLPVSADIGALHLLPMEAAGLPAQTLIIHPPGFKHISSRGDIAIRKIARDQAKMSKICKAIKGPITDVQRQICAKAPN
jgi:hypothetical protein